MMSASRSPRTAIVAFAACLQAALTIAVSGCGGRPAILEQELDVTGPIVVGRQLVYLDRIRERAILVRPYQREVQHVDVGRRPSFMLPTPDQSRLVVLCKGWVATARGEEDEAPSLQIIDTDDGETVVHELGSPFDEVAISDDDRYAVAFFSANAEPGETEVFRNPNSVAILDLESGDLAEKNVRSFGDVPRGVIFSPSTMAPLNPDGSLGAPRTLAVVFADGYLTLLDVTHPERREITVRLSLPGMSSTVSPLEMVFAPATGTAYLRASGTNDVYVLTLTSREAPGPSENDFVVSVNTLAAGSFPSDVALFEDGGQQKVLVANRMSSDLTVIDALTASFVTIAVGDPVDRILVYPAENPEVAVVFSQASPRRTIHFLDLEGVETALGRNLTTLNGAEPVVGMELIPNRGQALVVHDDARSVMSVLDLEERTLSPFTGHDALAGYTMTRDGSVLAGFSLDQERLGVVSLEYMTSRMVVLSHHPTRVITLASAPGEPIDAELRSVIVDHDEPYGLITVLPEPLTDTAGSTFALRGFLLEGLLDDRYGDR
jgi:hypothetical protein